MRVGDIVNYREGEAGEPKHVVEPYMSLPDEVLEQGRGIAGEWPGVAGILDKLLFEHPQVTLLGHDFDGDEIVFVTLGADEERPLVEVCEGLRSMCGFTI